MNNEINHNNRENTDVHRSAAHRCTHKNVIYICTCAGTRNRTRKHTRTHTHTNTHTHTPTCTHARMHARAHTQTHTPHTHSHTHTHKHTHTCSSDRSTRRRKKSGIVDTIARPPSVKRMRLSTASFILCDKITSLFMSVHYLCM